MTRLFGQCLLVCALACFSVTAIGAEKKSTTTKSSASKAKATQEAELTGRLPRYFSALVDDKQREEIYEIQATYREQIEELEKKLAELKKKQLAAIEKVLTTTQRKKLADLRGEKTTSSTKTASGKSSSGSSSTKAKSASSRSTSKKSSAKK